MRGRSETEKRSAAKVQKPVPKTGRTRSWFIETSGVSSDRSRESVSGFQLADYCVPLRLLDSEIGTQSRARSFRVAVSKCATLSHTKIGLDYFIRIG